MDNAAPTRRRTAGVATVLVIAIAAAVSSQRGRPRLADDDVGMSATATPVPTTDVAIPRGAALYAAHCASCHGANLEGQPDWKRTLPDGSLPAPPHDDSGHTWHHGDGELLRIIAKGGTIYMPESKMPGFADVMSDDDMRAVLAFIKASWGTEQVKWQAEITAGEVGPQAAP